MIELIEKINEFGWGNVIICVVLICSLIVSVKVGINKLLTTLGLRTEASIKEEQLMERLDSMQKEIDDTRSMLNSHEVESNKQYEKWHQQSIDVRNDIVNTQDGLVNSQQEIKNSLGELKLMFIKKEINDMRWEILDFCSAVSAGRKYNKESYDHVLETYEDYEKILIENQMTNGRVDLSMEFIREKYAELIENGF